tara:strand:+ start:1183 stop:1668 length:486 start_codon:yes stop_codon:yes gene_type:complete
MFAGGGRARPPKLRNSFLIYLFFPLLFSTALQCAQQRTQNQAIKIHSAGQDHTFILEVANTPEKREKGLMYRKSLKDHEGMLFLFDHPKRLCFWMKNSPIPLDILLLNKQGVIVKILKNMKPYSQERRCFKNFAQRAIELKAGICHDKGIRVGDSLTFLKN